MNSVGESRGSNSDDSYIRIEKQLPPRGERVIIVCRNYRCYGYLDEHGIWRNHFSGEEIQHVIGWAR